MNDHDYIKNRFENDGLKQPEDLTSDRLRQMIEDDKQGSIRETPEVKERKPSWRRPLIGLAACACLAFALIPIAGSGLFGGKDRSELTAGEDGLISFSDYGELDKTLDDMIEDQDTYYYGIADGSQLKTGDLAEAPSDDELQMAQGAEGAVANDETTSESSEGTDHSSTYTQVDDVDEADVVKTDGKYIYHVSYMENQVIITRAGEGNTKRISAIGVRDDSLIEDLYIDGDRLIVISETRVPVYGGDATINEGLPSYVQDDDSIPSVSVTCYDISDRKDPVETGRYTQSGTLLSSRMTGGRVILVTSHSVYGDRKTGRYPAITYGDEEPKDLDIDCIQCIPSAADMTYTVVGMIDPTEGKMSDKTTKVRAVLGGSEEIYCNTDELYITATTLKEEGRRSPIPWLTDREVILEEETRILKVDFSKKKISYSALGVIPGSVNDQFSMDAKDGYFRIATTSGGREGATNDLFVLDKDLKEVGSLRNFARDEHIEAVRYIGDYAYVITYEQIDPLFIIDLSDPKDPEIKGHVKISGFSTLLVPVDGEHILGFGFSTETTQTGEAADGLKLALFDVSDPQEPKVADSMSFSNVSSEIQYEHKALLVGPSGSYYAIPYDRYSDDWIEEDVMIEDAEVLDGDAPVIDDGRKGNADFDNGIMLFDARGGKLELTKQLQAKSSVKRCIYIGDYIYAICTDDSIEAYKL